MGRHGVTALAARRTAPGGRPDARAGGHRTGTGVLTGRKVRTGSGVDWVTMSDSCHTETTRISETRKACRVRSPEQREGLSQRAFRESWLGAWAITVAPGASDKTRKLTRFLLFGLTWSRLRPTVTVRNRY